MGTEPSWRYRAVVLALGFAALILVGLGDYWTGPYLSFSLFYLIPVLFLTWRLGWRTGAAASVLGAVEWFLADRLSLDVDRGLFLSYWNAAVQLVFYLGMTFTLAKLKNLLRQARELARTDPLTGILNRRAFLERAGLEMERSRRYGRPFTLAFLDLDEFKELNDRMGHMEGDAMLRRFASALADHVRSSDCAARLGGDEFVLLLSETPEASARTVLESFRDRFSLAVAGEPCPLTFSAGLLTFAEPPLDTNAMLKAADDLLYEAKRGGRDRILFGRYPTQA